MIWKVYKKFALPLACCLVLSLGGWAQNVVPTVGKTAKAVWGPPAGTPAGAAWIDTAGNPETLKEFELAISTALTDMNSPGGIQPPPVFRSPRMTYSGTNEQAIGQFLAQVQPASGTYILWIRMFDAAGNESLWSKSNEFGFDLVNPAPASGVQVKVTVTVEVLVPPGG